MMMPTDERTVVDFDHHGADVARCPWETYDHLRSACPVAWTNSHGGYWIVTRHADVTRILREPESFSSDHLQPYGSTPFEGTQIPPLPFNLSMVEMDPPRSLAFRRLIQKPFSPSAAEMLAPRITQVVDECLDRRIETGSIELVDDLVNQVPARVTLEIVGLPPDDWASWARPQHAKNHTLPGTPERESAMRALMDLGTYVADVVRDRRRSPRQDVISSVVHGVVDARPLTDEEAGDLVFTLIAGGLGTVTGVMAHSLVYLARNEAARRRLIEDPTVIPSACEEFMRFFTPSRGIARTVVRDVEVGDQRMRAGDRVLLLLGAANHDPETYEHPDVVVLDRVDNRNLTFGAGAHKCVGAPLARAELMAVVSGVLRRLPDYAIDMASVVPYPVTPTTIGFEALPATFTPGAQHRTETSSPRELPQ